MKHSILLLLALGGCARPSASNNDTAAAGLANATAISNTAIAPPGNATASATPTAEPSPESVATSSPAEPAVLEAEPAVDRQLAPLPDDVLRFVAAYEECEHWAGEEPYDADRRKEIEAGVKASCTGIDARLNRLKRKYGGNAEVRTKLADYAPVHM